MGFDVVGGVEGGFGASEVGVGREIAEIGGDGGVGGSGEEEVVRVGEAPRGEVEGVKGENAEDNEEEEGAERRRSGSRQGGGFCDDRRHGCVSTANFCLRNSQVSAFGAVRVRGEKRRREKEWLFPWFVCVYSR